VSEYHPKNNESTPEQQCTLSKQAKLIIKIK
jgi:hypothetical protein